MKRDFSPNGFATSVFLLGLAVLLVIGGIGSYLYSKHSSTSKQTGNAVKLASPGGQSTSPGGVPGGASSTPPATTTPTTTDVTVTIAGAGFQITVPASLKDLTYHVNGGNVTFSTTTLTAAIPSCAATNGAFETITKGSGTYKPPANAANGGLLKQYGDYYLAYTLRTGPCAKGLSVANQNLLDDQTQTFYGALSTVR